MHNESVLQGPVGIKLGVWRMGLVTIHYTLNTEHL